MKTTTLILAAALLAPVCQSSEIRNVGGKPVDIAPVVEWFKARKGERPMPHWKRIQVVGVGGQVVGANVCLVKTESGETKEVVLANAPKSALDFWARDAALLARFGAQERTIKAAKARHAALEDGRMAVAYNPSVGAAEYGFLAAASIQRARTLENMGRMNRETANAWAEHQRGLDSANTTFAMFTGKMAGKWEIWDCGRVNPLSN